MSTQIGAIEGSVDLDVKPLTQSAKKVKTEIDNISKSLVNAQKGAKRSKKLRPRNKLDFV